MERAARARPDGIVLIGYVDAFDDSLFRDKMAVLGPNRRWIQVVAGYTLLDFFPLSPWKHTADGAFAVDLGTSRWALPPRGRAFMAGFDEQFPARRVDRRVPYAAQAAEAVLQAIAESDGTRAGVRDALFGLRVEDGIVGDFEIDEYGDPTAGDIAVYRAEGGRFRLYDVVRPPAWLVDVVAGG